MCLLLDCDLTLINNYIRPLSTFTNNSNDNNVNLEAVYDNFKLNLKLSKNYKQNTSDAHRTKKFDGIADYRQ